jgi:CheY-like chemotaxis protein
MSTSDKGPGKQAGAPPGKWRILCVDDDPEVLAVLSTSLSMRHEVVAAESGVEALKIIAVCEPDFVICDIRMPDLDGFATVEAIRQHPAYADIPVFFLTAERSRDAAKRGFEAGCNLYLTKPFDPMRLLDNIDYFTRESGHVARAKSHALGELEHLLNTARRAPAPPPVPAAPAPAPAPTPRPPSGGPSRRLGAEEFAAREGISLKADHDAFLEERKAREREFWKKRYARMQAFIDEHMRD